MLLRVLAVCLLSVSFVPLAAAADPAAPRARDYQQWKLPREAAAPADNQPSAARVELGKMLFFDPRLSRNGNTSCASCHNPSLGWSDGLATARGFDGKLLERASPSIVNAGYNTIHMWDGRNKTLEDQATGPMEAAPEMNTDFDKFFAWLANEDPFAHNVFSLSDSKTFDLGSYPKGQSKTVVFDKPGTVEVECAIHPGMQIVVEVKK